MDDNDPIGDLFRAVREEGIADYRLVRMLFEATEGKVDRDAARLMVAELESLGHTQTAAALARFLK